MEKKDISKVQGEKSRQTGNLNSFRILQTLKKPLTFSGLLKDTGFSKPVLAKHLKTLMREGSIYKDTIKLDEDPEKVGKIVYRHSQNEDPDFDEPLLIKYIEHSLKMPKPNWSEESKDKMRQYIREIVKVYLKEEFHKS